MKMGIEAQRKVAVATAQGNHSYGQLFVLEDNLLKSSVDESLEI